MKTLLQIAFASLALAAANVARAGDAPTIVPTTFHTIYVPGGFDSNDNVQFVGEGYFHNSCYKPAETQVTVDHDRKEILVGPKAYEYGGVCLQIMLPFDRVIEPGILEAGEWKIREASDRAVLGELRVRPALTNNPDDYLYAPISQAFFRQKGSGGEVFITGEFTNSCLRLKEVKVEMEPNVIVVLPIAEMATDAACLTGHYPFSKRVSIDKIEAGRYLLHVRSMNNKAVNALVQVTR